jgi:tetratricopeptide (TPR) repeat protein
MNRLLMRRLHIVVITVAIQAAALAAGGPALAQPASEDTASKQEQARKLFEGAEAHKRRGDEHTARGEQQEARSAYGLAAEAYSKAFELYEHPAFIYNLAQMRRLRGELRRAIRAYETYLVLDPGGAQASMARTFIAQLTLELDAEESRQPGTDPGGPDAGTGARTTPSPPDQRSRETAGSGQDTGSGPASSGAMDSPGVTSTIRARDPDAGRGLRMAGMVSAAVGLAGLGLGVKFGLDARAAEQDLSEKAPGDPWGPDDRERIQSGQDAERNMIISMSLGGAALVAGGVLYGFGVVQGSSQGLALRPTASADGVWVHLSGSF